MEWNCKESDHNCRSQNMHVCGLCRQNGRETNILRWRVIVIIVRWSVVTSVIIRIIDKWAKIKCLGIVILRVIRVGTGLVQGT